jgi:hypothetical protein
MQSNDMSAAFEAALENEPPVGDPTDAVFGKARRIVRRQQGFAALGGLATAATVAVAVLAVSAGGNGIEKPSGFAPAATSSSGAPTVTAKPNGPIPIKSGKELLRSLKILLPSGDKISKTETQDGYAGLVLTDSHGSNRISLNVQNAAGGGVSDLYDCAKRKPFKTTSCQVEQHADGTVVLSTYGPDDNMNPGVKQRLVDVLYLDGTRVVISIWNADDYKRGAVLRHGTILSLAQLETIALSPQFHS